MIGLALASLLFAASGPSVSHFVDPFDSYMAAVKANTLQPGLREFASECGVDLPQTARKFAIGGNSWQPVKNLPKSVYDLESDYFTTGEFRNSAERRFAVIWSMDLETEIRFSYCFDQKGVIQFADSRVWEISQPDHTGWSFARRWVLNEAGRLTPQPGKFYSLSGRPISKPKLEEDEQKHIDWSGAANSLGDLKLPAELLR
jgi:hypothetical protein